MILLDQLRLELEKLDLHNLRRNRRTSENACAPHIHVDGRPVLAFCSNDYLGLAAHPKVVAALREGVARYGAGSGASHLISGHSRAHALLELRLAEFMSPHLESARALYFSTGYMANLAVIAALSAMSKSTTEIFSEALNHASLIDATRLSRSSVRIYPHRDVASLEALLRASPATTKIVATDSVFSMDGDLAPLPDLLTLCEKFGAWLVVDDAHGFGVLGRQGRGALEHFDLRSPHLIYMGTLGKAAGVAGAFVAAHATVVEWLVQKARPYIYSTAAPPALAHALLTSLDLIQGEEGRARRTRLNFLISQFKRDLQLEQRRLVRSDTAIQPLLIGDSAQVLHAAASLYRQGIWVAAIRPPTVPAGSARLRITLSAAHTDAEVNQLVGAINSLEELV